MAAQSQRPETAPVAVVILNYDGREAVERCARSLREQSVLPERIVLVDNASVDFDEKLLREALGERCAPLLEVVRNESNLGFAKGMNRGLRWVLERGAAPVWVMPLNNDTELAPDFFERFIVESIAPNIGMVAPKLLSLHDRETLDGTGIGVSLDGMSTSRGQRERDEAQYDRDTEVLLPNGVAPLYRAKLLRDVGLYDEDFWAYCEDTDLGLRAWIAGWDCRYLPECVVYHARSSSHGEHSLRKLYLVERNHYWVAIKNLPVCVLALNPIFTVYRYLVQGFALASGKGQGAGYGARYSKLDLARVTLKGVFDAITGAPVAFHKRMRQRHLRRRARREVLFKLWARRMPFNELILK